MKWSGGRICGLFISSLLLAALVMPGITLAQQTEQEKKKKQEEYDTPYTEEEYAAYEAAVKEPDLGKRPQMMLKFLKDNPKSALLPHVVAAYKALQKELFDAKQYQPLAVASEGYLTHDPTDFMSVAYAAESFKNINNHEKYIEYGLKVFAKMPSGADAFNLTKAYEALKNDDKYTEWALKTMELLPDTNPANMPIQLEFTTRLMQMAIEKKQLDKGVSYANKLLPLLAKAQKPPTATDSEWKEYIGKESSRAWTIIATSYYEKEKWKEAINAYQKILSYSRKNDVAYYRIGLCYWKLEDPDQAIDNFAICYVLDGTMAKSSYDYLERLYKALHNGTTVGLKRVLDEARVKVKGL